MKNHKIIKDNELQIVNYFVPLCRFYASIHINTYKTSKYDKD